MASFRLTREAIDDVDAIWLHIYPNNPNAADAVGEEIRSAFVLFWVLPKYPNYMIVYNPHAKAAGDSMRPARHARS